MCDKIMLLMIDDADKTDNSNNNNDNKEYNIEFTLLLSLLL